MPRVIGLGNSFSYVKNNQPSDLVAQPNSHFLPFFQIINGPINRSAKLDITLNQRTHALTSQTQNTS